jgi:hypothetical protein
MFVNDLDGPLAKQSTIAELSHKLAKKFPECPLRSEE